MIALIGSAVATGLAYLASRSGPSAAFVLALAAYVVGLLAASLGILL